MSSAAIHPRARSRGVEVATRADYARLQRDISAKRSLRRRSASPEQTFDADTSKEPRSSRHGNSAGHSEPAALNPRSNAV